MIPDRLKFLESLTLGSVDSMRSLTTSEEIVAAVAFAARAGHSDATAYRFVTTLVMLDDLDYPAGWPTVLRKITELERFEREATQALQAGVEAQARILGTAPAKYPGDLAQDQRSGTAPADRLTPMQTELMEEARRARGTVLATNHRKQTSAQALVRKGLLVQGKYYDLFHLPVPEGGS